MYLVNQELQTNLIISLYSLGSNPSIQQKNFNWLLLRESIRCVSLD